jgi:TldD protein
MELGCDQADVRVERLLNSYRTFHDVNLESSTDNETLGICVRVVHSGVWGFAAGIELTPNAAAELVDRAVATAKVSRPLTPDTVVLSPEPTYPDATWVSSYEVNPFDVEESEKQGRILDLCDRLLSAPGVNHTSAVLWSVQENKYFANLTGTRTTQQRVRLQPQITAVSVGDFGFATMRTLAPPVGRGWEYLIGTGYDFDAEIARLPEHLAEHVAAPSVEPGRYDLVIDPSNLFLTIHESIGHATELDRALGYESAYAGTSFATFDQLGTLHYGSPVMNVTGDRVVDHGLSTIGYDDEGVAAQQFDIVRRGTLVGYQLNRQMAAANGLGRSNGCAFADSPGSIPMQRMPNVSLQPDPAGPSTEELISAVDRGIYIVGDKSWSIDMQRYNFQFTGQRFFRIENGKLAGQVKDVAYQATTTDFWRSLEAVGNPSTYVLGGAFNCGKGQPGQVAPVSHGSPAALFRGVSVLNTQAEGSHS